LKITREQYRKYWKKHVEVTYKNKFKTGVVAYNNDKEKVNQVEQGNNNLFFFGKPVTSRCGKIRPWRKLKGNCKLCGKTRS
jgi:hypothetical protein